MDVADPRDYDPLVVRRTQSWLLSEGWKRAGAIGAHDVPLVECVSAGGITRLESRSCAPPDYVAAS